MTAMPPRYLVLANADSPRWQAYAHDLTVFWRERGIQPDAQLIPWREVVPSLGELDATPAFDAPAVVRLESLDVSGNRLDKAGIAALKRACGAKVVKHSGQFGPNSDEMEYLWMGDME